MPIVEITSSTQHVDSEGRYIRRVQQSRNVSVLESRKNRRHPKRYSLQEALCSRPPYRTRTIRSSVSRSWCSLRHFSTRPAFRRKGANMSMSLRASPHWRPSEGCSSGYPKPSPVVRHIAVDVVLEGVSPSIAFDGVGVRQRRHPVSL